MNKICRVKRIVKSSPNYELKALVLSNGYVNIVKKLNKNIYRYYDGQIDYETFKFIDYELKQYIDDDDLLKEAVKVCRADYQRRKRLVERISLLLNAGNCLFLTLTFTDDVLDNTSCLTRRKYVQQFLKSYSNHYVANIDYGFENEREHYHAVILVDSVNHNDWSYGIINFERINRLSSNVKLAKYICKLVNHAIKETTKRNYVIYSRSC